MDYSIAVENICTLVSVPDGYNGHTATIGLSLVDNEVYEVSYSGYHKSTHFNINNIQHLAKYKSLYRHYFKSFVVYDSNTNNAVCELQDVRNVLRLDFRKYYALPTLIHLQSLNK